MRFVTHRCDSAHSHGEGSGCEQYPCEAVRYNDGTMAKTCGEPCSWVMGKGGHGNPPWQTTQDGARFDPSRPDPGVVTDRCPTCNGSLYVAHPAAADQPWTDFIHRPCPTCVVGRPANEIGKHQR